MPEATGERRPFRFGLLATAGGLLAFTGFLALARLGTILVMLAGALFLAIGLDRPVSALTRRGLSRPVAVTVMAVTLLIVLCGVSALLIPDLVDQAGEFFAELPGYLQNLAGSGAVGTRLSELLTPHNLAALAAGVIGAVASLAGALFFGGTTLLLTLFVLGGLPRIKHGAYRLVPASDRERVRELGEAMLDKVGSYLVGAVMIAFFAASAALLWCLFTGIPYPLLLALVVGVCDMIPQIGATLGSTVVILVALSVSPPLAVFTLLFFCAYQGLENWVVYPRVMSRAVKISSLAAIASALVGGALFGVLGVLVAVPVYASVQLLMREVVFPRQDAL